jgi:hypothetical protein
MKRLVVVLALALVGCGLTMTRGPGDVASGQRPDCTETMDAPKRDAIGAVIGLVTILVGVLSIKRADNEFIGVPLVVIGGVVTAGFYASGGIGYYRVRSCRKAIAQYEIERTR